PWSAGPVGVNGGLAANKLAAEADLVTGVGTRFSDFTTASMSAFQHPDVKFIGINVAPLDAYKLGALALVGDARATLQALARKLDAAGRRPAEDRKSTRLNSSHVKISYAVFCLKKKKT